ncbi:MAG TPA: TetR/AcrR family transcriptional regulator [Dehalococcoidia bacterium]|jgi:AcrR family transcriptional regulator
MESGRRDRRVLRSRRLLQEALVALILERGYAAVTVQAVLDRADVGRATFYAHFTGKEALLLSIFEELQASIQRELAGIAPAAVARFGEGIGLLQPLFAHAAQRRRLYRALLGSRAGAALLAHLREILATPLRGHLQTAIAQHRRPQTVQVELVVTAFVSAVLGVLVWWLEADLPYTAEEMDRVIERLLAPGIGRTLELHAGLAAADVDLGWQGDTATHGHAGRSAPLRGREDEC